MIHIQDHRVLYTHSLATRYLRLTTQFQVLGQHLVLLHPLVHNLRKLRITDGRATGLERLFRGRTAGEPLEIPAMHIHVEVSRPTIALDVGMPLADLDLVESHNTIGSLIKPVLRAGVSVVEDDGRETGNRVVGVGEAVLVTSPSSDELGKRIVSHAGRAKGDEINGDLEAPADVGSGDGADGGAEGVTGDGDLEGRVGLSGGGDRGHGTALDFGPGGEEAGVDEAAKGVVTRDLDKDEAAWVLDDLMLVHRDKWIRRTLPPSF